MMKDEILEKLRNDEHYYGDYIFSVNIFVNA